MVTGGMRGATRSRPSRVITSGLKPWHGYAFSPPSQLLLDSSNSPAQVLEVCYKCGVKAVTVYAFSIENFNRPKYEVDGIMQLAKVKLEQLIQHGELLERYGASVRVLGQRDLISPDVLDVVDRAVATTAHNKECVFCIGKPIMLY